MTDSVPEHILRNWWVRTSSNGYQAPEMCGKHLCGDVETHPRWPDGGHIKTSSIQSVDGRRVRTHSSIYILEGPPHPNYLQWLEDNGYKYNPEQPIKIVSKPTRPGY